MEKLFRTRIELTSFNLITKPLCTNDVLVKILHDICICIQITNLLEITKEVNTQNTNVKVN